MEVALVWLLNKEAAAALSAPPAAKLLGHHTEANMKRIPAMAHNHASVQHTSLGWLYAVGQCVRQQRCIGVSLPGRSRAGIYRLS